MNVAQFQDYLYGRGKADRTTAEYVKWLRRLTIYSADHDHTPATIPPHLIRRWADDTIRPSWASRKQARTAVKHYAQAVGRDDEPWYAIRVPAKPLPRPRPHEAAEARALRDAAELHGGRQATAVFLLLYTGARPSEVAGMRWDWIDLTANTIDWQRSKVSDEHGLPIHPVLAERLRKVRPFHPAGHLFLGNNGREHVSAATVWAWTRRIAAMAGLETSPKRLRATVGTRILEATGDLDAAAGVLGHRSVDTTRGYYVDTSKRRLVAAVDALDY